MLGVWGGHKLQTVVYDIEADAGKRCSECGEDIETRPWAGDLC